MARGPLPRLPALAAAPRLHPSPRGRRGGRARSLADSSAGFAGLRAAAFAAATESWGGLGGGQGTNLPRLTVKFSGRVQGDRRSRPSRVARRFEAFAGGRS